MYFGVFNLLFSCGFQTLGLPFALVWIRLHVRPHTPRFPLGGEFLHTGRLLRGEVSQFAAVGLEVIKFPRAFAM